jgi:hypothetical protein
MTKQELQVKISDLELTLNVVELNAKNVKNDLEIAQRSLANVNKPVITKETLMELRKAIDSAVGGYCFDRVDEYEYDFHINYDNQLELERIEFNGVDDLTENIADNIEDLFNIEEDED